MSYKILITCPPMLKNISHLEEYFKSMNIEVTTPDVIQTISEDDLINMVPDYDGWIIGDDPATEKVFRAGKKGRLKAAVKWGIGVDNVDFDACKKLEINITNTPNMFGSEVADIAVGYVIGLARETYYIDREIRKGKWPKNVGISLEGKTLGLIGFGDIGQNVEKRVTAMGMNKIIYDPAYTSDKKLNVSTWPQKIEKCDFLVFTCALNKHNLHMLNKETLSFCKDGVRVVNVARGGLIKENDLCEALRSGKVYSAALDVFESEPLNMNSFLIQSPLCILGSHNSSNTIEAVQKTNFLALKKLLDFLG